MPNDNRRHNQRSSARGPSLPGRFLTEPGIEIDQVDEFQTHSQIADTLRRIAETSAPPFAIGLFGGWGTGKTFILRLLRNQIRSRYKPAPNSRVKFLYFDVWKYSRDPLRRWILLEMEQQLAEYDPRGFEDFLTSDGRTLKSYLRATVTVSSQARAVRPELLQLLWRYWWAPAGALAIIAIKLALSGTSWQIIQHSILDMAVNIVLAIVAFPVAFEVARRLGQAFWNAATQDVSRSVAVGPAVSAEQFSALFHDMVQKATASDHTARLVLCFDNLDRSPSDVAFDTLSTIRTFMEEDRCIYIVPCDDRALERRLSEYARWNADVESSAMPTDVEATGGEEFLLKIFHVALRLPAIIPVDMQAYLTHLLIEARLTATDEARDVMFIAYGNRTPRHLKRFINDFVGYSQLAHSLEEATLVGAGELTKNQAALAKMIVLHLEWPDFVETLARDPNLWEEISTKIAHSQALPAAVKGADLAAFLQSSWPVEVGPDLLPWLFLKRLAIDPSGQLEGEIRQSLAEQNIEEFGRLLTQPDQLGKVLDITRLHVTRLARRPITAIATLRTLLAAWQKGPDNIRSGLGPMVESLLKSRLLGSSSPSIPDQLRELEGLLDVTVDFITHLPFQRRAGFVSWAVGAFAINHPVESEALKTLAPILTAAEPDQRRTLTYNLVQALQQQPPKWAPLVACHTAGVLAGIATQELLVAIAQRVDPSDTSPGAREAMGVYLAVQTHAAPDIRTMIGTKVGQVATRTDSTAQYGVELITKLNPDSFLPEVADRALQAFRGTVNQRPIVELGNWVAAAAVLVKAASPSEANNAIQSLAALFHRLGSDELIPLVEKLSPASRVTLFEIEQVRTALANVPSRWFQTNPNATPEHIRQLYGAIGMSTIARYAADVVPRIDNRALSIVWRLATVEYESKEIGTDALKTIASSLKAHQNAEATGELSQEISSYLRSQGVKEI